MAAVSSRCSRQYASLLLSSSTPGWVAGGRGCSCKSWCWCCPALTPPLGEGCCGVRLGFGMMRGRTRGGGFAGATATTAAKEVVAAAAAGGGGGDDDLLPAAAALLR